MPEQTGVFPVKWVGAGVIVGVIVGGLAGSLAFAPQPSAPTPNLDVTPTSAMPKSHGAKAPSSSGLPLLLDIGSVECVPCKLMAPILERLKEEYRGKLDVQFMDVDQDKSAAKVYGVDTIPTQLFFDATGKEVYRHVGFVSGDDILAKWRDLGVDLPVKEGVRREAAAKDSRPPGQICNLCDGDINPKTRVTIDGPAGKVLLCSPHCWAIYYSCFKEPQTLAGKVAVADWVTGQDVPMDGAFMLSGADENGRPMLKAFSSKDAAVAESKVAAGVVLPWPQILARELAARCGFCDRAVYPEDAAVVRVDGLYSYGCCAHCAMGVAARMHKDIEVAQRDALSGEMIRVKTMDGSVCSVEPAAAVAWFGQRRNKDGKWVSAGCFHQGFFVNQGNLETWLEKHPLETGRQITIEQSLRDKMKLSPAQIGNACKIGECKPK